MGPVGTYVIRRLGVSGKSKGGNIGRHSVGFNSVYNVTDILCLLTPERALPRSKKRCCCTVTAVSLDSHEKLTSSMSANGFAFR